MRNCKNHLCLVLGTQVRVRQACGHVEHEGVVKLAHLVGHVDVLAASLDHDLSGETREVAHTPEDMQNHASVSVYLELRLFLEKEDGWIEQI